MRHLGLPPALSRLGATPSAAIRLWNGKPAPRATELRQLPALELFEYEASPWWSTSAVSPSKRAK